MTKEEEITYKALLHAKNAFYNYLENLGYDGAYWDIIFNAYEVTSDFKHRLKRYTIEEEYKDYTEDE